MHRSRKLFLGLALITFFSSSLFAQEAASKKAVGEEAYEIIKQIYSYDQGIPLDAKVAGKRDQPDYIREKIAFQSVHDDRVPAYLAIPKKGEGPFPCVLVLHGITSSKDDWWRKPNREQSFPEELLKAGYAVFMLDAQYHGERISNNDFESAGNFTFRKGWTSRFRAMFIQSVIDYRRALDYLETRDEIDDNRIGVIGYSMGGMMTFSLTALEDRIKTAVAAVTPPLKTQYSATEPHNFANNIEKQPFLMLMGKTDNYYTIPEAETLHQFIKSPIKELVFYDTGHFLPRAWEGKAIDWMNTHLK